MFSPSGCSRLDRDSPPPVAEVCNRWDRWRRTWWDRVRDAGVKMTARMASEVSSYAQCALALRSALPPLRIYYHNPPMRHKHLFHLLYPDSTLHVSILTTTHVPAPHTLQPIPHRLLCARERPDHPRTSPTRSITVLVLHRLLCARERPDHPRTVSDLLDHRPTVLHRLLCARERPDHPRTSPTRSITVPPSSTVFYAPGSDQTTRACLRVAVSPSHSSSTSIFALVATRSPEDTPSSIYFPPRAPTASLVAGAADLPARRAGFVLDLQARGLRARPAGPRASCSTCRPAGFMLDLQARGLHARPAGPRASCSTCRPAGFMLDLQARGLHARPAGPWASGSSCRPAGVLSAPGFWAHLPLLPRFFGRTTCSLHTADSTLLLRSHAHKSRRSSPPARFMRQ